MEPSTWLMSDPTIILAPEEYELRPRCAIAYSRPVSGALAVSKLPYRDSQRDGAATKKRSNKPNTRERPKKRLKKQPKHDVASDNEEQAKASRGSSSPDYGNLKRTMQDLISRGDKLRSVLPPDSSDSKKQRHWEKRCRKHLHLLDEHLEGANHAIPSKSLRVDSRSLQAFLSVAQSYLQDLERIQDASATEPEASTTSGSESTDVSDSGQDSGNDSSHPSTSVLKKQPSTPAEEAVQEKWLSLARRSSFTAPTTSPVPILPPRTNEPELGRGRTCIRAPGPVAPLSFTSYAPRPSTPKGAEGHNDTPQKEDDPQPASSGMKRKRRRYPKWIGKSTTPIPPPILPPSSIQKMQRGDNGAVPEPSTPSSPIQPTGLEK
ncbi:hypothetical protein PG985_006025 [Apiospora marii]|uniref:uncharacterized protein n=1 Tax=Apiospora marii TaxID=335849 RepID=UPI00312F77C7